MEFHEVPEIENDQQIELPTDAPPFPPLDSMLNLFSWYIRYFCRQPVVDCRGYSVEFRGEDFVHLVKLLDKFGKEPRNRAETIRKIKAGEFRMFNGSSRFPPNFSASRAKELGCALSLIKSPEMIVPNWQPLGKANPGEAYIKNFGKGERRRYRVLICGIAGRRRFPVTLFPRQRDFPLTRSRLSCIHKRKGRSKAASSLHIMSLDGGLAGVDTCVLLNMMHLRLK